MTPAEARALYEFIDREVDAAAGGSTGFSVLLASQPFRPGVDALAGYAARHAPIRRLQERALGLFAASLRGDADPELAAMVLGDAPPHLGLAYHRGLAPAHMKPPLFFRTDEPATGRIAEIQCPGSAWSSHDQLRALYAAHGSRLGGAEIGGASVAERFAQDAAQAAGAAPVVHYLIDNASVPAGARYFIQKTRAAGVRYFGWDRGIHWRDCNLVRSHDWTSLANDNFHRERLAACAEGRLRYDLSPCALFDSKLVLALPFEPRWRESFDDEIRAILPYAQIVRPDGMVWRDGSALSIERICAERALRTEMYAKYAGTDQAFNWGSRAVFYLGSMRTKACGKLFERIQADTARGRHWILQEQRREACNMSFYTRDGELQEKSGYRKTSAFYGPSGLYGVLAYALRFPKVHGTPETVASIAI